MIDFIGLILILIYSIGKFKRVLLPNFIQPLQPVDRHLTLKTFGKLFGSSLLQAFLQSNRKHEIQLDDYLSSAVMRSDDCTE